MPGREGLRRPLLPWWAGGPAEEPRRAGVPTSGGGGGLKLSIQARVQASSLSRWGKRCLSVQLCGNHHSFSQPMITEALLRARRCTQHWSHTIVWLL